MSLEHDQAGLHETAGHEAFGLEPEVGGAAMKNIVVRHPDGLQISSLDTDHDGVVTMREQNPPRPESGHDVINAVLAEGALAGALVLTAVATMAVQRFRGRN